MNNKKQLKFFLKNWSSYLKDPLQEAVGDTTGLLSQVPPEKLKLFNDIISKIFIFDAPSFDIDAQIALKKQIIKKVLKKNGVSLKDDHVFVGTNLAKSADGTSLGIIKGTSGKSTPAEEIATNRPDATGFVVYDNLTRGLGEIQKGLARHAKFSDPALKEKVERLKELAAAGKNTSAEYKKLTAEVEMEVGRLNIQTLKVEQGGGETEVAGALSGKQSGESEAQYWHGKN